MAEMLKPVAEQVIVITGSTSGIGLATARLAGERGARVVVHGRIEEEARAVAEEIRGKGGQATHAVGDVADFDAMQKVAETAVREFGRIDTWVNNAGVTIYGRNEEIIVEDARRLFDTNYWGVVVGTKVALPHLRREGGVLINIGSTLSERAIPLQGHYAASKHAVKAFTDSLRMELEKEGVPVSVVLVKPGSIDTPYAEHARNYMEHEPTLPPPVYAPEVVARTILRCAERPVRDAYVGGGAKMLAAMDNAPRLADRYMEATMFRQQQTDEPTSPRRRDGLYEPLPGRERGGRPGHVAKSSAYTAMSLNPVRTVLGMAAIGAGIAAMARSGIFTSEDRDWARGRQPRPEPYPGPASSTAYGATSPSHSAPSSASAADLSSPNSSASLSSE